jgi:uncharacterized protein (TIGR02147 family)
MLRLMMSVYDFDDYREFIKSSLKNREHVGVSRRVFAEALGCQPSHVSAVLSGNAHMSAEQGGRIAQFFSLDDEQAEFLLILIQYNRAGSAQSKAIFERALGRMKSKSSPLRKKLNIAADLPESDKAKYYSSWIYPLVHVMASVREYQRIPAIAKKLRKDVAEIETVLEFLVNAGLLKKSEASQYTQLRPLLHLDRSSVFIHQHHTNWRLRAIDDIGQNRPDSLHYSGAISLAKADIAKVKRILSDALRSSIEVVKNSKEEEVAILNMDFFSI